MPKPTATELIATFVDGMLAALNETQTSGMAQPIERRKLRTITAECKQRATGRFLAALEAQLQEADLYTFPALTDSSLLLDDWVRFSTAPFPPVHLLFPTERDLQRFVEASLGTGDLSHLEPFKENGRNVCREYKLPYGGKIDLLCQERTKSGKGALVAIELKKERETGTIEQLVRYLEALNNRFPDREVKGIIISGRGDDVAAAMLSGYKKHDIQWLCYKVGFVPVGVAS